MGKCSPASKGGRRMIRPRLRQAFVFVIAPVLGVVLVSCLPLFLGCSSTVGPTLPSPEGYGCSSALIDPPDNSGGTIQEGTGGDPDFVRNDPTLSPPTFPDPIVLPPLGDIPPSSLPYDPSGDENLPGGSYAYSGIVIDGVTVTFTGDTTLTSASGLTMTSGGRIVCVDGNLEVRVANNITMQGSHILTEAQTTSGSVDLAVKCGGSMSLTSSFIRTTGVGTSQGGDLLVAALGGGILTDDWCTISQKVTPTSGPDRNLAVLARDNLTVGYQCTVQAGETAEEDATGGNVLLGTLNGDVMMPMDGTVCALRGAAGHAVEIRSGQGVVLEDGAEVYNSLGGFPVGATGVSIHALNGPIRILPFGCDVYSESSRNRDSGDVLLQARGQVLLDRYSHVYTGSEDGDTGDVTIIGYRCGDASSPAVVLTDSNSEVYTGDSSEGTPGNVEIQGFVSTEGTSTAISWDSVSIRTGTGFGGGDVFLRTRCCGAAGG